MGKDPRTSVTDPWDRVRGHDNLFIPDASFHVTKGGFNPFLTIMAQALRGWRSHRVAGPFLTDPNGCYRMISEKKE